MADDWKGRLARPMTDSERIESLEEQLRYERELCEHRHQQRHQAFMERDATAAQRDDLLEALDGVLRDAVSPPGLRTPRADAAVRAARAAIAKARGQ